ncbi:MAG: carboxypeptidase regulatory-like domain-containing protein [Planctomycetes bacterium]|nr:carboxypeptidase regulatory-like domain-containing protein [Planctomycetota bacterium]
MRSGVALLIVLVVVLVLTAVWISSGGGSGEAPPDLPAAGGPELRAQDPVRAGSTVDANPGERAQDPVREPLQREAFRALLAETSADRAIAGVVLAPDGRPQAGALVWLLLPDEEDAIDRRTSDAQGRFLFPMGLDGEVPPASFRVAAHLPEHGIAEPRRVARPAPGEIVLVELRATHALGTVAGRVFGPGARPVPDHPVLLVRIDADRPTLPEWRAGRDDSEVRTADDGSFVARGLRPGTFEVDVAPRGNPAGFLVEAVEDRPTLATGAPPATIAVPWTRVDVVARGRDGRPLAADGFVLHVFAEAMAGLAEARFAAGQALEPGDVAATAVRELRLRGERASFWVAPGCFVIGEIEDGPRRARAGALVPRDVAVFELEVGADRGAPATLVLRATTELGAPLARVLVRLGSPGGVAFVPEGHVDLGAGHFALPDGGALTVPASNWRLRALAEPLVAGARPRSDEWLPQDLDLALAPGETVTRELRFQRGAALEFEIENAPSARSGAEPEYFEGRLDGFAVLRARAHLERADGDAQPLPLAMPMVDGGFAEIAGLPWRAGATTHARALDALLPGRVAIRCVSWRGEGEAGEGLRSEFELVPGRNLVRLRVDGELLVRVVTR